MSVSSDFYENYTRKITKQIMEDPEALFALALEKIPHVESDFDNIFGYVTEVDVTTLSNDMAAAVEILKKGFQRLGWINEEEREFGFVDGASLGNLRVNFKRIAEFPKVDSCAVAMKVFDFVRNNKDLPNLKEENEKPSICFEDIDVEYVKDLGQKISTSSELQLAVSFAGLSHQDRSLTGFDLAVQYVNNVEVETLDNEQLVDSIGKLRHTMRLLGWNGKESQLAFVDGASYKKVSMNYHEASGKYLSDLYPLDEAQELVDLVIENEPVLKVLFSGVTKLGIFMP